MGGLQCKGSNPWPHKSYAKILELLLSIDKHMGVLYCLHNLIKLCWYCFFACDYITDSSLPIQPSWMNLEIRDFPLCLQWGLWHSRPAKWVWKDLSPICSKEGLLLVLALDRMGNAQGCKAELVIHPMLSLKWLYWSINFTWKHCFTLKFQTEC